MSDVDDEVWNNWENCDFKCRNSFLEIFVVLCELVGNNLMVNELENQSSRERTQRTTGKHDYENRVLRKTTTIDDKRKPPVVRLAPMFYESVFREKNRAGNVGASQLRDQKLKFERD